MNLISGWLPAITPNQPSQATSGKRPHVFQIVQHGANMDNSFPERANQSSLDLLTGAAAIGDYLGWNTRRVYHVADKGYLPIKRIGSTLIARKSELDRALSATGTA